MVSSHLRVVAGTAEDREPPATLVDANVLIDIITGDDKWSEWSEQAVRRAADEGRVVINPIVYAEVSTDFDSIESLDAALPSTIYQREPLPYEAGFLAGKAYVAYRREGGARRSPLPDFYIGAHAVMRSYRLLTRDVSPYRTYFPTVPLIAPDP